MISSKTFVIQLIEFDEKLKRIRYSGDNATLMIYMRDISETLNKTRDALFDFDALIPDFLLFKFRDVYVGFGDILDKYFVNRPEPVTESEISDLIQMFYGVRLNTESHYLSIDNANYLCITIKSYLSENESIPQIKQVLNQSIDQQKKSADLIAELQKVAGEVVSEKYADIFIKEADLIKKEGRNWLIGIITIITIFIAFLVFEDKILPLAESTIPTFITLSYFRRLLAISFFLFVITFVIKQYNVKMHQFTLNRHRGNTLASYKLFIQSIASEDKEARSLLMREVSRSIFDAGQTGYISNKDAPETSNIINEVTKIIKPDDK